MVSIGYSIQYIQTYTDTSITGNQTWNGQLSMHTDKHMQSRRQVSKENEQLSTVSQKDATYFTR